MPAAASRFQQQRDDEESEYGGQGNEEHHAEDGDSKIYFPVDALLQALFVQDLTRFECEEEERSVVGDGRDVVRIRLGECPGIVAGYEIGERVVAGSGRQVKRLEIGKTGEVRLNGLFFRGSEGRLLRQHDYGNAVFVQCAFRNDDEVASWIRDAQLVKSFRGDRDNA